MIDDEEFVELVVIELEADVLEPGVGVVEFAEPGEDVESELGVLDSKFSVFKMIETVPSVFEPEPSVFEPEPIVIEPVPSVFEPVPGVAEPVPGVIEPEPSVVEPVPSVFEPAPSVAVFTLGVVGLVPFFVFIDPLATPCETAAVLPAFIPAVVMPPWRPVISVTFIVPLVTN